MKFTFRLFKQIIIQPIFLYFIKKLLIFYQISHGGRLLGGVSLLALTTGTLAGACGSSNEGPGYVPGAGGAGTGGANTTTAGTGNPSGSGCDLGCATGQFCYDGLCVCPEGQLLCGSACTDPQTDAANCGMCGAVCATGQSCVAGNCVGGGGDPSSTGGSTGSGGTATGGDSTDVAAAAPEYHAGRDAGLRFHGEHL